MYKIILGVNEKATNWAVRSELGRFPIHIEIFISIIKYLYHLLNDHNDNELMVNALKTTLFLNNNGGMSWFGSVTNLLRFVGLDYQTFASSSVTGKQLKINSIKKHLKSVYIENGTLKEQK